MSQRQPRSSGTLHSRRLVLEQLEDRCVPSAVGANPRDVTVMSQNLSVGADITPAVVAVLLGDPMAIIGEVTQFWQNVQSTRFEERATAIARKIDAAQPDLIGLQECIRSPGQGGEPRAAPLS